MDMLPTILELAGLAYPDSFQRNAAHAARWDEPLAHLCGERCARLIVSFSSEHEGGRLIRATTRSWGRRDFTVGALRSFDRPHRDERPRRFRLFSRSDHERVLERVVRLRASLKFSRSTNRRGPRASANARTPSPCFRTMPTSVALNRCESAAVVRGLSRIQGRIVESIGRRTGTSEIRSAAEPRFARLERVGGMMNEPFGLTS